jgi:hypothetical protein
MNKMKLTITNVQFDEELFDLEADDTPYVDGYEMRSNYVEQYYTDDLETMKYEGTWTFHVFTTHIGEEILVPVDQLKVEEE